MCWNCHHFGFISRSCAEEWYTASSFRNTHSSTFWTHDQTQTCTFIAAQIKAPVSVLTWKGEKMCWRNKRAFCHSFIFCFANRSCHSDITFYFSLHVCLFFVLISHQRHHLPSSTLVPHNLLHLSIFACLSYRLCLLIILSPSPSCMTLKFWPVHQFALTVNCVENNSGCQAVHPGWGFRQIGHDGSGP